jgi:ATP-binding cassette subfamily C protein CydCD
VITAIAAVVAVGLLHSPALPALIVMLLVCLLLAPTIALRADRAASRDQLAERSRIARRFAALLGAAAELRANGVDGSARAALHHTDLQSAANGRRATRALGFGGAVTVFVSVATSVSMLAVSAPAVAAGTLQVEVVAVLVLLPLALIEPMLAMADAVQQWPSLRSALLSTSGLLTPLSLPAPGTAAVNPIRRIQLQDLAATWPGAEHPAFDGVTASVGAGEWLSVEGPSGSGKSTLLTTLLGHLPPSAGTYLVDSRDSRRLDPQALRRRVSWCPQDSHLFDSTLRGNLLIARPKGEAPGDGELIEVLNQVGLGGLLDRLPDGLDTSAGSDGAHFSGGERQRIAVARTLLTGADVVLLDEPTAHIDADGAAALMTDLRFALRHRTTIQVTHQLQYRRPSDTVIALGAREYSATAVR